MKTFNVNFQRTISTSAMRGKLVHAPIQIFGLEGRYAHALFSAASKQKKLDAVEKELIALEVKFPFLYGRNS